MAAGWRHPPSSNCGSEAPRRLIRTVARSNKFKQIENLKGVLELTAPLFAPGAALPLHASPTAPADTLGGDLALRRARGTPGAA
jgi:hypothetical protein